MVVYALTEPVDVGVQVYVHSQVRLNVHSYRVAPQPAA
jgi:hypothetical protein